MHFIPYPGVFLGGVITEYVSWPWVFFINVPSAVIALIGTRALMPAGAMGGRRSVDLFGALMVTLGLAAAVYGIVRAPETGWASGETWLALGIAAVLLVTFVVSQAVSREPLMRLSIFRAPNLGAANLAQLLLGGAWIPMWFFPQPLPAAGARLHRVPVRCSPAADDGADHDRDDRAGAAGDGPLRTEDTHCRRPRGSCPRLGMVVPEYARTAASGQTYSRHRWWRHSECHWPFIPSLGTAISAAQPEAGGLAAGIVNTNYQVGSALGLAAMTAVAAAYGADRLGNATALTDGFSAAFVGAGGIALAGAIVALIALRPGPTTAEPTPAEPDVEAATR